jgi:6-phosphogluconolactonase/glucosamine-6-phosphate isomerase/deaminase
MQIIVVDTLQKGIEKAKEILYGEIDSTTVLFLSGGLTPKPFYEVFAREQIIKPAAVGIVDERFGQPMHDHSNELMIKQTGLLDYFTLQKIPFYSMLQNGKSREDMAEVYDQQVRDLFFKFPKSVAILGIGIDGHIAGIVPNRKAMSGIKDYFHNPLFNPERKYLYISEFDDPKKYKERITMTFAGLSLVDKVLVLVFGKEKQKILHKVFTEGNIAEIPARFFQEPNIAKKTLFITDQKI